MNTHIQQRVSALPEVYQTIYGHPEWDGEASRDCNVRLEIISRQYDALAQALGRPLRVLDLGCAQGFFSLSLAAKGATVAGVDFQPENIDLCQALAQENPALDVSFSVGRIEEVIQALEPGQYDMAIGLSVFHHIVHLHGVAQVQEWLERLANCTQALILELALQEEPLYWGSSQPADPRELIERCAFYKLIGQFDTHLSDIGRPMFVISNRRVILDGFNRSFNDWRLRPYPEAGFAHKESRRYYFGDDFVCKLFHFTTTSGLLTGKESQRNRSELDNEVAFLARPPEGLETPALLQHGCEGDEGWLVMERLPGSLLSELLAKGAAVDREAVLGSVLRQLAVLEEHDLYHDDVRTWNILVDRQHSYLIDYGSISGGKSDCTWPYDLIQSFFILVNEICSPERRTNAFWRSSPLSPFSLPEPWNRWLYAVWQLPAEQWNFRTLEQLFNNKSSLPAPQENLSAVERWIAAQEPMMLESQQRQIALEGRLHQLEDQVSEMNSAPEEPEVAEQPWLDDIGQLNQQQAALAQQLEALNELVQRQVAAAEPVPLPPDVAALSARLDDAERQVHHLANENALLRAEIDKIHRSRSWRLTRPYRYLGNQVYLLRQYGFVQRCKHLAARVLRASFSFLRQHPAMKDKAVNLAHKVGLYQPAYRIYRRLNPLQHSQMQADAQILSQTEMQIVHPELLPPQVNAIYLKLKKNK
ncbi:methyltransferase domain-containing protein [Entomohabitans teleogrylli]|uniref:methyltransferase domain-containing protein n=1 Tax=Entomohabitans teleogrylli TaxID=1384589 RepID=UPI00073D4A40|nr:methyltransferase domain-containing protein [Entomohabitans teleogrylli]